MMGDGGNLLASLPERLDAEQMVALVARENLRIERIVSTGQASPPGFWYDQTWAEWVLILAGSAGVLFEDEAQPRVLRPGDYLLIPPHAAIAWPGAMPSIRLFGSLCTIAEATPAPRPAVHKRAP